MTAASDLRAIEMRLVLLGAPGSGKGTQAAILAERLAVPAVSTGAMLREAVADGSALGRRVEAVMSAGELVDDETMAEVVRERLSRSDARPGFILDGYPRTRGQADTLGGILSDQGYELDAVIHIEVPEQELVARALARKRADDQEPVILQRLAVYRNRTQPLIDYYQRRGELREVDGHQTIEKVAAAIQSALEVKA